MAPKTPSWQSAPRSATRPATATSGIDPTAGDPDPRFRLYRESRERPLRNELVLEYRWLAEYCARRFAHRGESVEDLVQVAQLGLVKAIERFDPYYGVSFSSFAVPTMLGEIKRHFRDATWPLRVPRTAIELLPRLATAADELSQRLGRGPTATELARELRVTEDDVAAALEVRELYRTDQFATADDDDGSPPARRMPTVEEPGLNPARLSVRLALTALPEDDQRVVYYRFYDGLTQSEIAARIGTSQVQVSRRLRRIYQRLGDTLITSST
jgi:RNA polymerase sigma-B factor